MSNLSSEHLIKCIIEKDKYKQTQLYLKEVQLQNQHAYNYVNEALFNIITTNNYPPAGKLFALRFLKDVFMSAQFHLIDELNQNIMKQIIKTCQFDKENSDKTKRGCQYFEQVQKRKKESDTEKVSYSYVLFSTQLVYVMGVWHALDQNNQTSDFAVIYEKLKKAKVPFPQSDKQLKFFKPQQKDIFLKNYKQWISKLPQIEEEQQQGDQKQNANQKSQKSIKSKQQIEGPKQTTKTSKQVPFTSKDQNRTSEKLESERKREEIQNLKASNFISESQVKKLKESNDSKDREMMLMKIKIDELIRKNKESQEKAMELENSLKSAKQSSRSQSKVEEEKLKIKYASLQVKYSTLESKYFILEKQSNQLKSKLEQNEGAKQRQSKEIQQQKQLLKKAHTERTETQEKFRVSIEEGNRELKDARQKIGRLQRQIDQLNTIKKSYKTIMEQDKHVEDKATIEKGPSQMQTDQKVKINELQNQIQETVEFYTKETIELKNQIKDLKQVQDDNQKQISLKDNQISSLNLQIQQKISKITQLESELLRVKAELAYKIHQVSQNKDTLIQAIDLSEIKPELKTQKQPARMNSMSDYLKSQQTKFENSITFPQKVINQDEFQSVKVTLIDKVKNKSLGKTQKSEEKLKNRRQRYSAGKTFHFSNSDQRSIQDSNEKSNRMSQSSIGLKKIQYNPSSNLWKVCMKQPETYLKYQNQSSFCKKSSVLNLDRKPYFQESVTLKSNTIQTVIPFIENYFVQKQNSSQQEQNIFKLLCLCPTFRERQPIFVDKTIQVKLFPNSSGSKDFFLLQVMNTGYNSMKIKAVSCDDQFNIIGDKSRLIQSNSTVEYRIETRNKDLNLRYPIISLIVTQDEGNRLKNVAYNVSLPLTLLEFTEMQNSIPDFYELQSSKLKVLKSESFQLNSRFYSLKECFPNLVFTQRNKSMRMESKQKELSWEGNLIHSFIQNVDTFFKISQVGNQVSLEFACRDYDKVSQNYAKAMIQALMFLLQ